VQRVRIFDALWVTSVLWKITTVLIAPVLVRLGRWRAIVVAAALGVITTVPYFLIFPAHLADFVRNNAGGRVVGHELGNLGFRQLLFAVLATAGASPAMQAAAQLAIVAAALAAAVWVTGRVRRLALVPALALWITVFFLVSPQVWEHHYVMLLPALVGLYAWRSSRLVAIIWLLLALPAPFGFIGLQPAIAANHDLRAFALEPAWQPLLQHASKALPALVLFGYCLRATWQVDAYMPTPTQQP
jgi:alpha-1,2-mannosyltransferase